MCPAYTFVFVGSASADLGAFDGLGNVRFLGKKAYEEIPHYGKCFDVAIMPWRQNRWIELCNPIKLKEYLALGKPIVSTPFKELDYYKGHVYVARGAEEFAAALRKALEEDSEERRTARRERVRGVTWEAQAEKALGAIRDAIGGRLKD
jgi:glycosyltransferase involved in cell wall biosynthesis